MIQVGVSDGMMFGRGVGIYVRDKGEGYSRYAPRIGAYGMLEWEELTPELLGVVTSPTMTLDEDVARAVNDALTRHFGGVTDQGLLVATLDKEQKRVEKMLDRILDLASRPQEIHLRKAEQ